MYIYIYIYIHIYIFYYKNDVIKTNSITINDSFLMINKDSRGVIPNILN